VEEAITDLGANARKEGDEGGLGEKRVTIHDTDTMYNQMRDLHAQTKRLDDKIYLDRRLPLVFCIQTRKDTEIELKIRLMNYK
jgi:hypothetical protein